MCLTSPRKWKVKLKEWSFEKHLSESDMKIVVVKVNNRKRVAGKDTSVFYNGVPMPNEKIENFKRRKTVRESQPASPSACKTHLPQSTRSKLMHSIATPGPITSGTPHFDVNMDLPIELDEAAELDDHFKELGFSVSTTWSQSLERNEGQPNGTSTELSLQANEVLPGQDISWSFVSDGVESTQPPAAGEHHPAPNEPSKGEEHDPVYSSDPPPVMPPFQNAENGQNKKDADSPMISTGDISAASESKPSDFNALNSPSHDYQLSTRNLCALSSALEESYEGGLELNLSIAQLLSMLPYLQKLPLGVCEPVRDDPSDWASQMYWELRDIAKLTQTYIEAGDRPATVLIYKSVIAGSQILMRDTVWKDFRQKLESSPSFSQILKGGEYRYFETTVLEAVLTAYFKLQLSAKIPSAFAFEASGRALDVMERLMTIRIQYRDYYEKLQSLLKLISFYFRRFRDKYNEGPEEAKKFEEIEGEFHDDLLVLVASRDLVACHSFSDRHFWSEVRKVRAHIFGYRTMCEPPLYRWKDVVRKHKAWINKQWTQMSAVVEECIPLDHEAVESRTLHLCEALIKHGEELDEELLLAKASSIFEYWKLNPPPWWNELAQGTDLPQE